MLKLHYTTQTWANWVMVAILAIAVISTTAGIFSTNTASAEARSCPWEISGQNGGVIIHFPEKTIYSSRTESDSKVGSVDTNITAGTWRVGLTSYDPHSTKANPYQPHEQWFLRLNYAQGGYVDTAAIADLPDNADTLSQVVNTDLAVTSEVTSVTAMHAFYPEISSPNSISPVCVLLEEVVVTPTPTPSVTPTPTPSSTPTPTATPTPSSTPDNDDGDEEPAALSINKTDHKDMIRPGHTLTYEIQVKNTGEGTIDDLVIQDSLPGAVTLEQVSSNPEVNGKTIIWGNTALAGGETLTYFVTVKVNQDADNGQTLVNAVKAKSEDKGISASDTDTTVVEKIGQIGAAKTEQPVAVPVTAKTGAGTTSALAIVTGAIGLLASLLRRRIG